MQVALITSGYMPVPASLGGAVETLDTYLIRENEKQGMLALTIISAYDAKAKLLADRYQHTKVKWIYTPLWIRIVDWLLYQSVRILRPHAKTISYRYILKRLHFISKAAKEIHDHSYDRVIIENHASLLRVLKKYHNDKTYDQKVIWHVHNEQNNLYGCETLLPKFRKIATVSDYILQSLKTACPTLCDEKWMVWKNCVDTSTFCADIDQNLVNQKRRELQIQENEHVVLFTGRLSPEKGIKELIEAFLSLEDSSIKLVIAGSYLNGNTKVKNAYEALLQKKIQQDKKRVILTGYIDHDQLPVFYAMADVVVVPSLCEDAAPLSVIEAITCGRPLITTYSGGIAEYAHPDCAILLKRDSHLVEQLARSIQRVCKDPQLQKSMSKAALEISKDWTTKSYYDRFLMILE